MASRKGIIGGINALIVAFPNYNPELEKTAALWEKLLPDLDDEALEAGILSCLTEKRAFAPSVGEIRAAAVELHVRAAGIPDWPIAYEEVCKMPGSMEYMHVTDEYDEDNRVIIDVHKLTFTHPVVEAVARQLGWPKSFPTDNPGVDRGQFRQAYEAEVSRVASNTARLPALQKYIDSKQAALQGGAPLLAAGLAKKLDAPK